jgi:hypothetical protein
MHFGFRCPLLRLRVSKKEVKTMPTLQENTIQQTLCIPLYGRMIA